MKILLLELLLFSSAVTYKKDSVRGRDMYTSDGKYSKLGRIFISILTICLIFLVFLIFIAMPAVCLLFICLNALIPNREQELFIPRADRIRPMSYRV